MTGPADRGLGGTPRLPRSLGKLTAECSILVCCGAGGVGKTTTAASLAVAGARLGRRVLVLTIDPSKRLAEALGVARNPRAPVGLAPERLAAIGVAPPGNIEAWMLDPKLVSDGAVRSFAGSEEAARPILENRLYQQGTAMVAGLHEYTAMKALQGFIASGRYDLVILDTPPSRNALDFLEAPGRLSKFLEGPIFKMFLPSGKGLFARAGSRLVAKVLEAVFGETFAAELTVFFGVFSGLLGSLSTDLQDMRRRLSQPDAAFVLVTTPSPAALTEAHFFHDKIRELGLPFGGFVLNRSLARPHHKVFPTESLLPAEASSDLRSALEKLKWLARTERLEISRDQGLLADLALRGGSEAFSMALPSLLAGAGDLETLSALAELILAERRSGPR